MSFMDANRSIHYGYEGFEKDITLADVLNKLKTDLEAETIKLREASLAVQQLKIAIAAIERDAAAAAAKIANQRPTHKRGAVSRAILDCLREGIGTVAAMNEELTTRGIKTSAPSISNAIQRLQRQKLIRHDSELGRWVVAVSGDEVPHENKLSPLACEAP